jgi:polyhydroxyalkanoate synthesis regulator phasin
MAGLRRRAKVTPVMDNERSTYMRKAIAAIASAAIVLGGLSVALVVQSPDVASAQEPASQEIGITVPTTIEDVLADLVEEGVITEEQSIQIAEALQERAGPHRGPRGRLARGANLETVAEVIGIEIDALRDTLRNGQSIAEVAEANGSSASSVIDALVVEMNTHLDQAVEDGKLTTEQADEIRADAPERIESMVTGEFEGRMGPRGHHRGMGPGPGFDLDDAPNSAETST